jgi:hypothetical protein
MSAEVHISRQHLLRTTLSTMFCCSILDESFSSGMHH